MNRAPRAAGPVRCNWSPRRPLHQHDTNSSRCPHHSSGQSRTVSWDRCIHSPRLTSVGMFHCGTLNTCRSAPLTPHTRIDSRGRLLLAGIALPFPRPDSPRSNRNRSHGFGKRLRIGRIPVCRHSASRDTPHWRRRRARCLPQHIPHNCPGRSKSRDIYLNTRTYRHSIHNRPSSLHRIDRRDIHPSQCTPRAQDRHRPHISSNRHRRTLRRRYRRSLRSHNPAQADRPLLPCPRSHRNVPDRYRDRGTGRRHSR